MLLALNNATYFVEGNTLFHEIEMLINEKDRIALIGRNGSGKSTLLKILSGQTDVDGGTRKVNAETRILLVKQELPDNDKTPLDYLKDADPQLANLYLKLDKAEPEEMGDIYEEITLIEDKRYGKQATLVLLGLGISEKQQENPMRELSGGLCMRISLASALLQYPDVLLLDEPTNHLDLQSIIWLTEFLKTYPQPFVIVSHDRTLLSAVINKTYHLQQGKLTCYNGDFNTYLQEYTLRQAQAIATNLHTDRKIEETQAFIDKYKAKPKWAAIAKTREGWIENLEKNRPDIVHELPPIPIQFQPCEILKDPILDIRNGSATYDTSLILSSVNFSLQHNARIGILGRNGQGKSTFLRMIMNQLVKITGEMTTAPKLRIGYFSQDQSDMLNNNFTVYEQLKSTLGQSTDHEAIYKQLLQFGFDQKKAATYVRGLSGGEKTRLALLILAATKPHLIILDEPSNHLDFETKTSLIHAINHFNGAVLLVSHDWDLLKQTMTDYHVVARGKLQPYPRGLEHYKQAILNYFANASSVSNKNAVKKLAVVSLLTQQNKPVEAKTSCPTGKQTLGHPSRQRGRP